MGALTNLYHAHDEQGRLLYVGISLNALARLQQHLRVAPWSDQVATLKIEKFPDRTSALAAERQAIVTKQPLYNVIHNRGKRRGLPARTDDPAIIAAIEALDRAKTNAPHGGMIRPKYVYRHEIEAVLGCSFAGLLELAERGRFPAPQRQGQVLCWNRDQLLEHLESLCGAGQ